MRVGMREAKARLSELLERAASGEETIITRRGKPVARLTPLRRAPTRDEVEDLVADVRRLKNGLKKRLARGEIREFVNDGRKY